MCCGCWKTDGGHRIDTPAVREAAAKIAAVYDHSLVGGGLHVVVDDFNLSDEFLSRFATADDTPEQIAAEEACLVALKALTFEERVSALGLHDGCWPSDLKETPPHG